MATYDFIQRFAELRASAKKGTLLPAERGELEDVKEKFAQAICNAQSILLQPGQRARSSFRVAVIFKVEIRLNETTEKTVTMDLSVGGFSALFTSPPAPGSEGAFTMSLTKNDVIMGKVRSVGVTERKRVSFSFTKIDESDAVKLEEALFDVILPKFAKPAK